MEAARRVAQARHGHAKEARAELERALGGPRPGGGLAALTAARREAEGAVRAAEGFLAEGGPLGGVERALDAGLQGGAEAAGALEAGLRELAAMRGECDRAVEASLREAAGEVARLKEEAGQHEAEQQERHRRELREGAAA